MTWLIYQNSDEMTQLFFGVLVILAMIFLIVVNVYFWVRDQIIKYNGFSIDKIKTWFYEFQHGHPFLLEEEVDIICKTRFEEKYKWMNDSQIQKLVKIRVKKMYKKKFPNAIRWRFPKVIAQV